MSSDTKNMNGTAAPAKKNGPGVYLVALAFFAAGLGYLVYSGLSAGSVYFLDVAEVLAMEPHEPGNVTQCRLFGTVAARDLETQEGQLGVVFRLQDQNDPSKTLMVSYTGAVPDTFKPGAEVIVEGGFTPASQTFAATTLMTKCPSKYEKENREASGV